MKHRSPVAVLLLPLVTFGIYSLYWLVATKTDINKVAEPKVPTAWLLIVPIVNFIFLWKYSVGAEQATKGAAGQVPTFLFLLILGPIGQAITQASYNKVAE
jgi:hypothetical protein